MMQSMTIDLLEQHWPPLANMLMPPNHDEQYLMLKKLLNQLMDRVGSDEKHPLATLMHLVGNLIDHYEIENDAELEKIGSLGTPVSMLKFLMDQRVVKQEDLKEIFGSQGNVSGVLNGKRELTLKHIQKLAEKFHVPASVFL